MRSDSSHAGSPREQNSCRPTSKHVDRLHRPSLARYDVMQGSHFYRREFERINVQFPKLVAKIWPCNVVR